MAVWSASLLFPDAQADLSLRWAHCHFVGFVMRRLNFQFIPNNHMHILPLTIAFKLEYALFCVNFMLKNLFAAMFSLAPIQDIDVETFGGKLLQNWHQNVRKTSWHHTWELSYMYEPHHEKTCFCHMRTTKAQISLRIRAIWWVPLLLAAQIV